MATFTIVDVLTIGYASCPSGTAWFYLPNSLTPIVIYGDASGSAIANPVTLSASGSATVYLSQLARMVVQDINGVTVVDTVINQEADTEVANSSSAFTGSTQKAVNDAALAAFGGQNFQYVPSGSWVGLTPQAWMNGVVRNVMAYGAVGATNINDGVTPADSAIAAAVADVRAAGGGVVYFPPGTYLLNSPIAVAGSNTELRGAGAVSTTLKINSGTNNGITSTAAFNLAVRYMTIVAAVSTTGKAISATTGGIVIDGVTTTSTVDTALYLPAGAGNVSVFGNSSLAGSTNGISATTVSNLTVVGGVLNGGTASIVTSGCTGVALIGVTAFLQTYDASSSGVAVIGGQASFVMSGGQPIGFFQRATGNDGSTINVATGATATAISLADGQEHMINANSGGAGTVTVPDPTSLPSSTTRNYLVTIKYRNAAGGPVTWAFSGSAFVHVGGAVPANTNGHTIAVLYLWDGSKLREISRGDTTT